MRGQSEGRHSLRAHTAACLQKCVDLYFFMLIVYSKLNTSFSLTGFYKPIFSLSYLQGFLL